VKDFRNVLFLLLCAGIAVPFFRLVFLGEYSPLRDDTEKEWVLRFVGNLSALGVLIWYVFFGRDEKVIAPVGLELAIFWVIACYSITGLI
jgi:hypothetical protein